MKKTLVIAGIVALIIGTILYAQNTEPSKQSKTQNTHTMIKPTIYQFKVTDIAGNTFDFASLKGKKILIVNTASECGLTPQYEDLETLYTTYKSQDLVVVGFPSNNFGGQEPGTNKEIASFCQKNYGVSFPMMNKVSVKGDDMCAIYQFLTQKDKNGLQDSDVEWNFQKYLINKNGELEKVLSPRTLPTDPAILNWIKA
ncbi:glutathione peroxidase [Flavobacterium crassostreae]|uniref:Glutathione peroxidase n=1 Tax=Flavobacterium crassostreae TaxID=1763534 RepID=A0A1B9DN81_9FLAO|nr:glutathione peroxidase [Flavobacterium crassostreae]OCB71141.1 glutathione peroxidase [Flavobacterium crassostreae]